MFSSILSAIAAIPTLLNAIQQLMAYFKKIEDEQWIQRLDEHFSKLEQGPTTVGEKQDAAKNIGADIASS